MSDPSDPTPGAPPVTNPNQPSPQGSVRTTGGGPMQWEPPGVEEAARLFPNYEILGLLGRGGMGAVYKARQLALDRFVAIKLLPLEVSTERDFADRFVREARTMAKLSHPNIIAVHDFGTTSEGHLFFVMEFVGGANLHSIIHEVGLDPDQALYLAGEVCAALAYAHGKGVVHRDIKPANVMVDRESKVKVADFGLARLTETNPEMHGMTMTGMVMGTPDYMAPEQKRGTNVDHRADIYSLGVMLYEMVCREVPQGAFDLPSRRTGCDQRLDAIVLKAMQQLPERRYQSTKEMEADVEAARKPVPSAPIPQPRAVVPRPGGARVPVPRPVAPVLVPRHPVAPITLTPVAAKSRTPLFAGIAVVVLGAIVAIGMAVQKSKPKQVAERGVPTEEGPEERPGAKLPEVKPSPAPIAEPPKEKPVAPAPEVKTAPEPPKEKPVATSPEMKPAPVPVPVPDPPGTPPVPDPRSATEKWIAEQEPQWQAAYALEVTAPFEKGSADLKKQYVSALDGQLAAATRSGQLNAVVTFRDEMQRLAGGGAPGEDDTATPVGLKAMRAGYRKNFAILEADRAARAKAVHARYDAILAQNLTLLTQRQRIDEALLLKAKREELAASWIKPSALPEVPKTQPAPTTPAANLPPTVSSTPMKFGTVRIADATKERPFVNSLGMEFVPVPGTQVLFCRWETRVKDYAEYARGKKVEPSWTQQQKDGVPISREPEHPVCAVPLNNAIAFCEWLTKKEVASGKLPQQMKYRLPTDEEWSRAVGLAKEEGATPSERARKNGVNFPWGTGFPPPNAKVGNYADSAFHEKFPSAKWLDGYTDGYAGTAPVGSFPANDYGIYDMGGNLWEWCEDLIKPGDAGHVVRGGSWDYGDRGNLLSSSRRSYHAGANYILIGFRCVVEVPAR